MNVSMNDIPPVMTRKEAQEILKVSKKLYWSCYRMNIFHLLLLKADTGLQGRHRWIL